MSADLEGLDTMRGPTKGGPRSLAPIVPQLFNRRATQIFDPPNGQDVAFACLDHEGQYFYCKDDRRTRPVRATELIFTRLADRLGIRTAPFAVIEHDGETYFASRHENSASSLFAVRDFLATPRFNEIGQPERFPGEYLAQLLAFDLFIGNPDRDAHNFLLVKDGSFQRLCAIDFADADLMGLTTERFPVASSRTVVVGKLHRAIHGAYASSGVEMLDRILALPADAFAAFVDEVPDEWLSENQRGELKNVWGSPVFETRLALLRSGIIDGGLV